MAGAWQMAIEWNGPAGQGQQTSREACNEQTNRAVRPHCGADHAAGVSTSAQVSQLAKRRIAEPIRRSCERAVARAGASREPLEQEPSLRAARSQIEVAQGMREPGSRSDPIRHVVVRAARRNRRHGQPDRRSESNGRSICSGESPSASPSPTARSTAVQSAVAESRASAGEPKSGCVTGTSWRRFATSTIFDGTRRDHTNGSSSCCGHASRRVPRRHSSAICWMSSCAACEADRLLADRAGPKTADVRVEARARHEGGCHAHGARHARSARPARVRGRATGRRRSHRRRTAGRCARGGGARRGGRWRRSTAPSQRAASTSVSSETTCAWTQAFRNVAFAPDGGLERVRGLFHYWSAGAMVSDSRSEPESGRGRRGAGRADWCRRCA